MPKRYLPQVARQGTWHGCAFNGAIQSCLRGGLLGSSDRRLNAVGSFLGRLMLPYVDDGPT
jgi:hypothetical protein